jgi:hypothetical protein
VLGYKGGKLNIEVIIHGNLPSRSFR